MQANTTSPSFSRYGRVPSDSVETLSEVRDNLAASWSLFRQVAERAEDPNFAYDVTLLHLKVYLRFALLRAWMAVGLSATRPPIIRDLTVALRNIKRQTLLKLILMEPGTVMLVANRSGQRA